jgi:dipeptidase E
MTKKIVAIGGGENGRIGSDGIRLPYETGNQDKEIIRLTGKEHPNFLFIAHSQPLEIQEGYFRVMVDIYEKKYGCICKDLKSDKLMDKEYVQGLVDWADIIYEGGGATEPMINLWKETGFDDVLKKAYESGKVMCGISAGAICWFNSGYTDDPKLVDAEVNRIYALDLIDAYFTPHCQKEGKIKKVRNSLKYINKVGLLLSNCTAIEIIDDEYRIIKTKPIEEMFEPYAYKTYWSNDEMFEEEINNLNEFKPLNELLSRNIKGE